MLAFSGGLDFRSELTLINNMYVREETVGRYTNHYKQMILGFIDAGNSAD